MSDSFAMPWAVVHQVPLPMGFSRQEDWSGLPFPSPGDLPDPGIGLLSPALAEASAEPPGKWWLSTFIATLYYVHLSPFPTKLNFCLLWYFSSS